MKKLLFLSSVLFCCYSSYGQTLSAVAEAGSAQNDLVANGQNYANTPGTRMLTPYISGATTTYRGRTQPYSLFNTSAGDTFVWSVPAKRASVQSGQGTDHAMIFFKAIGGTETDLVPVTVTITNALGEVTAVSLLVTTKLCENCPIQ